MEEFDEGGSGKGKGAEKSLHKRRFDELEDLPSDHSDDPDYTPSAEATKSEQEREQGGAMLGKNLTVLNGDPSVLPGSVIVPVDPVLCTGIAVPKPLADTAKPDGHKRVVVPNLFLETKRFDFLKQLN
eukprot:g59198.t1